MNTLPVLGVDIAKAKFDVALYTQGKAAAHESFRNDPDGFARLDEWLHRRHIDQVHACMESTNTYWEQVALHLQQAGHTVSVVNPAQIKGFAKSELSRTKTDPTDADLIARFCASKQPPAWTPPTPEIRELRALVRRLDDLNQMLSQEENRLTKDVSSPVVRHSLETTITVLKQQIKEVKRQIDDHLDQHPQLRQQADLIASIPGVGTLTAANLIAEFQDIRSFQDGRQLAAYAGLSPQQGLSGSSVRRKTRLCKIGSARLRKALYMPAVVALRYNPAVQVFADRLREHGKHTRCILGAIMRKLLHWVHGVLKSGRAFDAAFAIRQMKTA